MMNGINQAMIDVRGVKQTVWKREMDRRPDIRIKYASKYDERRFTDDKKSAKCYNNITEISVTVGTLSQRNTDI